MTIFDAARDNRGGSFVMEQAVLNAGGIPLDDGHAMYRYVAKGFMYTHLRDYPIRIWHDGGDPMRMLVSCGPLNVELAEDAISKTLHESEMEARTVSSIRGIYKQTMKGGG